jgi:hypothetical protein
MMKGLSFFEPNRKIEIYIKTQTYVVSIVSFILCAETNLRWLFLKYPFLLC